MLTMLMDAVFGSRFSVARTSTLRNAKDRWDHGSMYDSVPIAESALVVPMADVLEDRTLLSMVFDFSDASDPLVLTLNLQNDGGVEWLNVTDQAQGTLGTIQLSEIKGSVEIIASRFDDIVRIEMDLDSLAAQIPGGLVIDANEGSDTLIGSNVDMRWNISGSNFDYWSGSEILEFRRFENFVGGIRTDNLPPTNLPRYSPVTYETYADVADFGAVGDGVTDDTAAIQEALNAHDVVYLSKPRVVYKVSSLQLRPGQVLLGVDPSVPVLKGDGTAPLLVTGVAGSRDTSIRRITIRDLHAENSGHPVLQLTNSPDFAIQNNTFIATGSNAVTSQQSYRGVFENNLFQTSQGYSALSLMDNANAVVVTDNRFVGGTLDIGRSQSLQVARNQFENIDGYGIRVGARLPGSGLVSGLQISRNHFLNVTRPISLGEHFLVRSSEVLHNTADNRANPHVGQDDSFLSLGRLQTTVVTHNSYQSAGRESLARLVYVRAPGSIEYITSSQVGSNDVTGIRKSYSLVGFPHSGYVARMFGRNYLQTADLDWMGGVVRYESPEIHPGQDGRITTFAPQSSGGGVIERIQLIKTGNFTAGWIEVGSRASVSEITRQSLASLKFANGVAEVPIRVNFLRPGYDSIFRIRNLKGMGSVVLRIDYRGDYSSPAPKEIDLLPEWTEELRQQVGTVSGSQMRTETDIAVVTEFGVVGDGRTDDTDAIQRALDASDVVFFPQPEAAYRVSTLVIRPGHIILGPGKWIAGIQGDGTGPVFRTERGAANSQITIRDLHVENTTFPAVLIEEGYQFVISDSYLTTRYGNALAVLNSDEGVIRNNFIGQSGTGWAAFIADSQRIIFENNTVTGGSAGNGVDITGDSHRIYIQNTAMELTRDYGVRIGGSDAFDANNTLSEIDVTGNYFEQVGRVISIGEKQHVDNVLVSNNYIGNNTSHPVKKHYFVNIGSVGDLDIRTSHYTGSQTESLLQWHNFDNLSSFSWSSVIGFRLNYYRKILKVHGFA